MKPEIYNHNMEDAVKTILHNIIGSDTCSTPLPNGLEETPRRVTKMYQEVFSGYNIDPKELLKTFEDEDGSHLNNYGGMVIVKNVEFYSFCEHHMCPFHGKAHIAYIPNGKVVGLSKLVRLLEVFTRRLQVQERITEQVADTLETVLAPTGVMVALTDVIHTCMTMRGVRAHGAQTDTASVRGAFLEKPAARAEFYSLINRRP